MKRESGFTLVEIITSLVLLGVIATFSAIFMVRGMAGYFFARDAADAALSAQIAINRISLELRAISTIIAVPGAENSIKYTSDNDDFTGIRKVKFSSNNLSIYVDDTDNGTDDGTDYQLIDNVSSPVLNLTFAELDGTAGNEVAYIDVGFTVEVGLGAGNVPSFSIRVYPRNMIPEPP